VTFSLLPIYELQCCLSLFGETISSYSRRTSLGPIFESGKIILVVPSKQNGIVFSLHRSTVWHTKIRGWYFKKSICWWLVYLVVFWLTLALCKKKNPKFWTSDIFWILFVKLVLKKMVFIFYSSHQLCATELRH
jgi:hypothetical protein